MGRKGKKIGIVLLAMMIVGVLLAAYAAGSLGALWHGVLPLTPSGHDQLIPALADYPQLLLLPLWSVYVGSIGLLLVAIIMLCCSHAAAPHRWTRGSQSPECWMARKRW